MIWAWVTKKLATSILSRWILGGLVATIAGVAAWQWHSYKEHLREQGQQVCIQEINRETVETLERALAEEREVTARLVEEARLRAEEMAAARERRAAAERKVVEILRQMKEQERDDETYKGWARTPVPDGVADRLRNAAARSDSDSS